MTRRFPWQFWGILANLAVIATTLLIAGLLGVFT